MVNEHLVHVGWETSTQILHVVVLTVTRRKITDDVLSWDALASALLKESRINYVRIKTLSRRRPINKKVP